LGTHPERVVKLAHPHNDYLELILGGNTITGGAGIRRTQPIGGEPTTSGRFFSLPSGAILDAEFPDGEHLRFSGKWLAEATYL